MDKLHRRVNIEIKLKNLAQDMLNGFFLLSLIKQEISKNIKIGLCVLAR